LPAHWMRPMQALNIRPDRRTVVFGLPELSEPLPVGTLTVNSATGGVRRQYVDAASV